MDPSIRHLDNLILNFGVSDLSAQAISSKVKGKSENCEILKVNKSNLDIEANLKELKIFEKVDSNTRIYIFAHGGLARNEMIIGHENPNVEGQRGNEIEFSYKEVSNYLKNRLQADKVNNPEHHLTISVIACHAGLIVKGKDNEGQRKYFASQLQSDLNKTGFEVDVLARNSLTSVLENAGENSGRKFVRSPTMRNFDQLSQGLGMDAVKHLNFYGKRLGTKSKFTSTLEGKQIVIDAYIDKFSKFVIQGCAELTQKLKLSTGLIEDKYKDIDLLIKKMKSKCEDVRNIDRKGLSDVIAELKTIKSLMKDDFGNAKSLSKAIELSDKFKLKNNDEIYESFKNQFYSITDNLSEIIEIEKSNNKNNPEMISKLDDCRIFIRESKAQLGKLAEKYPNNEIPPDEIKNIIKRLKIILNPVETDDIYQKEANQKFFLLFAKSKVDQQYLEICEVAKEFIFDWNLLKSEEI